ncbi:hypothetical protein [Streptomyces boncukensis]|uniref:CofH/MqnC-like C-terminal domain-containing protein n=1 Tax=Streptomyces boncukensis TaxID=2711219 RepID=A0A6G4WS94_9ACTN|nr:hypothetical protein [Streptomyces boncukensis]
MDAGLRRSLEERIHAGGARGRLSREDGLALFAADDLAWLGGLAHRVRTREHGDAAYFGPTGDGAGDGAADGAAYELRFTGPEECVEELLRLRERQSAGADGGVRVLVPRCEEVTGAEALRVFAGCRLLLDNVPHLRVLWTAHGEQLAQLALQYGADDTDGPDAAAGLDHEALVATLRDAGLRPVERDVRFAVLREFPGPDPQLRESPQPMRI